MKALALSLLLVSCGTVKPEPPKPVYDKTFLLVIRNETQKPTWSESATATIQPLTSVLTWVVKQIVP